MKIKNPETGEVIVIPQGMEDAVRDAIESGNDPMEAMQMKYGGIHINPANKGKFNATKKATGKTTEELTHSKNPLTRKRAIFAQNASRWKHQDGGQAMQQQQPQGGGQQDQMQQLVQMAEQALAQGASPEEVAQMLIQQGVPEQVVQQVIQYAIQDLQQQQQAQGQNPEEEAQEQMQQQNPQEEQAEMGYGGMGMYGNGGGIDNPGFRALPAYVQQDIINNMRTGGKFLRKAELGTYEDNSSGQPRPYKEEVQMDKMPLTHIQNGSTGYELYGYDKANPLPYNMDKVNPIYPIQYHGKNYDTSTPSKTDNKDLYNYDGYNVGGSGYFNRGANHLNNAANYFIQGSQNKRYGGLHRMDIGGLNLDSTSSNANWGQGLGNLGTGTSFTSPPPTAPIDGFQMDPNQAQEQLPLDNTVLAQNEASSQKPNGMYKWASGIGKAFSNNNVNYGKAALETTKGIEDLSKGTVEIFGNNRSNRNALGDEANNLRSAMRNDYQRTGKRPTDGNAIISKYGGKMMQDGGATYADKMKVSKNSPEADFIAEKGEYIVNNGVASKLETGGSHASGNDTAISLDKSSNPSYVLSDTPRLKQLQFGGKRVSPSKYAEMATVEALGKTPDQILKAYTAFTKRAGTEGKVFGDKISDSTNQLLAQKYQKDLATVKQIADQAYHKQEQLKHAMGMDNDLDHAQEVNGMSMAKSGGMQDGVHMNYFNAPAVQYGGSPQLFSDPSGLGYNTTQMAYGGQLPKAGNGWINTILNFESNTGSTQGTGLQNYGIQKAKWSSKYPKMWEDDKITQEEAIDFIEKEYLPKVKDYPEDVQKRLVDYAYNTGRNIEDVLLLASGKKDLNSIQTKSTDFNLFNKEKSNIIKNMSDPSFLNKIDDAKSVIMQDYWKRQGTPEVYNATSAPRIGMWNNQTSNTNNTNTTATAAAAPTSNYPTYIGGKYPSGKNTPGSIKTTNEFRGTADQYTKDWGDSGLDLSGFKTAKEVQEATYKELLKTPEGRDRIREMWKYGNTALGIKKGIGKGLDFNNLSDEDLLKVLPAYTDDMLGVRTLTPVKKQPTATTTTTTTKKDDEVITGDETKTPDSNIEKGKEEPDYDFPAINAYLPQPYGRNPIGLALAQPQTIRPAKLNIQPELNEYNRGIRGAFRGTQGNTSVDVAQQMQGLNNLYGAQNKLYGQKYNFDEQSRMGAEQFNAQAIMNTDAGNIQRIGAQQDAIARREGILDTQRRTDFQAGLENAQKENAYGLSKEFINKNFSPLSNSGNMYIYDPSKTTPVEKEKSYTKSQWEKITADEKRAAEKNATAPKRYGGSLKKIKLKLRK
jgi:hypothetical protein